MSKHMKLRCAAKINLSLDVTGKREDGYHDLESVFQTLDIYDTVELTVEEGDGIELTCRNNPSIPTDSSNLAWMAAEAMLDASGKPAKITIELTKRIPTGAGMGGGSADAAAVLFGLNKMLECGLSDEQLREIGAGLGADVPFLLLGGTAYAEGIGEILTPLPALPETLRVIVVKGDESVSTAAAYRAVDALTDPDHPDTSAVIRAVKAKDTEQLAEYCGNLFEEVTDSADVERARMRLMEFGALCAVMTGSGAAVFGIFPDEVSDAQMQAIAVRLQSEFSYVQACHPVSVPFVITEQA